MDINIYKEFEQHLKLKDFSVAYKNPVSLFLRYCHSNKLNYLTFGYNDFRNFFLVIREGHENGYINNFINSLRCFYKFLLESGKLSDEKVLTELIKTKHLKVAKKKKMVINLEQVEEMIKLCVSYDYRMDYKKLKAILYFMFFSGVRKSELINIKRIDINFEDNSAIIRVPNKSKKERKVHFTAKVAEVVQEYFVSEPEILNAFNMTRGKMDYLFEWLKKFNQEIMPKTMRASFAQMLAEKGVDIKIAQNLLGHSDLQTTEIYYDPTEVTVSKVYHTNIK